MTCRVRSLVGIRADFRRWRRDLPSYPPISIVELKGGNKSAASYGGNSAQEDITFQGVNALSSNFLGVPEVLHSLVVCELFDFLAFLLQCSFQKPNVLPQ